MTMYNQYQNIVVIGCGTIAYDVLRYCHETVNDCAISYIEYAAYPFNAATAYANKMGVACISANDNVIVRDYLINIGLKTLVISANNTYIFPKEVVRKSNLTIVNFHNALLPRYRGLNAASWVIFHQEKQTGITWHYVSTEIDKGNVIIQKCCEIPEDISAGELSRILMQLGDAAFKEILQGLLEGTIESYSQNKSLHGKLFKSSDIPGGGRFSLSDNVEEIYRLLRALDYGPVRIFPYPCTCYQDKDIIITGYKVCEGMDLTQDDYVCLPYKQNLTLYMKYKFMEANG